MPNKRAIIDAAACRIFAALTEDGLPTSPAEVRRLPSKFGIDLIAVADEPDLEADLTIDARERARIRYNSRALPSHQMLYIWHDTAEYLAITGGAERSLFEEREVYEYSGRASRGDVRHLTAVRCEDLYIEALRAAGYDVRLMERRQRERRRRQ